MELHIFSEALLFGALLKAVYDVLRVFRRVVPGGIVRVSVEDVLYWGCSCVGTVAFFHLANSGGIRGYIVAGIAIGALLYHFLLGKWMIAAVDALAGWVKKHLKKFRKAVTILLEKHMK